MLPQVVAMLACPMCAEPLDERDERGLACTAGHRFDYARQGYVSLLRGDAHTGTADTAAMVQARVDFLGADHYKPLTNAVAALCAGAVVDAGAGTGHYLAAAMRYSQWGVALDISKYAMRRAARVHPHVGAVVADLWSGLPIRTGAAHTVLNVFAPRNASEFRRVLRPRGRLIVVTPSTGHLAELVPTLGLLSVDGRKDERLTDTLQGHFRRDDVHELAVELRLRREDAVTLAGMSPSAHHATSDELTTRASVLDDVVTVTAAFRISVFRPL